MPNVVLKVPTGGGKTYLEVSALSRIGEQGIPAGENQALPQPPHAPVTVSEGVDEFELDAAVTSSSWLWIGGSSRHPVPGRPAAEAAEGR